MNTSFTIAHSAGRARHIAHALAILLLCLSFSARAGTETPGKAEQAGAIAGERQALVWEVRRGDHLFYLAGTMHVLKKKEQAPRLYRKLYDLSPTVVFETDIWNIDPETADILAEKPWFDSLSGKTQEAVENFCDDEDEDECYQFLAFKPALFCAYAMARAWTRAGFDEDKGIDRQYIDLAFGDGKDVGWLENHQEQLRLLNRVDGDAVDVLVRDCATGSTEGNEEHRRAIALLEEMALTFAAGDAPALTALLEEELERIERETPGLSVYYHRLLGRHRHWIDDIGKMLKKPGPILILVGYAHLIGEDSLVGLLRQKGFSLRPLHTEQDINPSGN